MVNASEIDKMYREIVTLPFNPLMLDNYSKKLPKALSVHLSLKEARSMNERTKLLSGPKSSAQIDPERVCRLLSCPTPDLKGIYYPVKKYWWGSFSLLYRDGPVFEGHASDDARFYHELYIQVPRVVVEHATSGFTYQETWKEKLAAMCGQFEHAIGCIKLDATSSHYSGSIINRFADEIYESDIRKAALPGYAWLMCITKRQLDNLGGIDAVKDWRLFHQCTALANGGAMLQLTEHVDVIEKTVNDQMVSRLRPYLEFKPTRNMDELPVSFRLSLSAEDVIVTGKEWYQLNLPV